MVLLLTVVVPSTLKIPLPLWIPPPWRSAEFPLMVLLLTVVRPFGLWIPPPLRAEFPLIVLLLTVVPPSLKIPPPRRSPQYYH